MKWTLIIIINLFINIFYTQGLYSQRNQSSDEIRVEILIPEKGLDSIWHFRFSNFSRDTIFTSNFATIWNRFVIVTPDSSEIEYCLSIHNSIKIYPGETKIWSRDLWGELFLPLLKKYRGKTLQIYWRVYDRKKRIELEKNGIIKNEYKTYTSEKMQIKL